MRRSSRPAVRWFAAGLTAFSLPAMSAFSADALTENTAYTYTTPAGEKFFGIAVRAADLSQAHRPADRHVLLVDTSASQVGDYRRRELEAAKAFLTALPSSATVSVVALDVTAEPLTAGFVSPREALASGISALEERVPLGATDLAAGLEFAVEAFGDAPAGSVVYVGDGMSGANLLRSGELKALTSSLRAKRIPVHAYSVGVNTDWHLLGVLAHQTGGVVELDAQDADAVHIGQTLAEAATAPLVYPQAITVPGDARLILGDAVAPLRADRDTILLGRGERPDAVSVTVAGAISAIAVDGAHEVNGLPAIRALALASEKTGGLDMPAAGQNLLVAVDGVVEGQIEQLADAATVATKTSQLTAAKTMFTALSNADPAGRETERLQIALAQAEEGAELPLPPAPAAVDQDLIGAEIDRQRILTQQMTIETSSVIDEARQIRQSDPGDALNLLKRQENQVRVSSDIDPEARRQLLRRLSNEIVLTANLQEKQEVDLILRRERIAQLEAEERMIERMVLEEALLEQLVERVRALMVEGYHGEDEKFEQARIVAQNAVNVRPGNGPATAALFTATAADQLNKFFRLRALRSDRLLETLYQVELSHIPFPDEPPIVYPAPEIWKALTERRKNYAAVSLEKTGPSEERIRNALDQETDLQFPNTPLRQALQFLADYHEINIIIDEQALEEEGLTVDDNVDLVISGITLRSALKILLERYDLTYVIEDEVMKITTQARADEKLTTRVYPVADLVMPIIQLGGGLGGGLGGQGGGLGGQGGFGGGQGGLGGGLGGGGLGGGGLGGGGLGGGGFFSIPAPEVGPANAGADAKPATAVPQKTDGAETLNDAELEQLLDNVLDGATSAVESAPSQAFASIRDVEGETAGKKK